MIFLEKTKQVIDNQETVSAFGYGKQNTPQLVFGDSLKYLDDSSDTFSGI
jgi:hypothetical protein